MGLSGEVGRRRVPRHARGAGRVRRGEPPARGGRHRGGVRSTTRSCRSTIPQKKGAPLVVDRDEPVRADTTADALAKLKPAFKADGTVTAGNAPGVNDGAAALVVMAARTCRRRSA